MAVYYDCILSVDWSVFKYRKHPGLLLDGWRFRCVVSKRGDSLAESNWTLEKGDTNKAMDTDNVSQNAHRHETDLRVIGQALATLGIDSFDLVLAGDNFVVQGGPESPPQRKRPSAKPRLQLFRLKREKVKPQRTHFYISGMRFRDSDVLRLNRQAKDIRSSAEQCPDTQSLSHGLRMIGAHIDTKGGTLLRVIRQNQLFTVWYKGTLGRESKETFTQTNLYDLWVHLYKQRRNPPKRNGTTRNGL